MVEPSPKQIKSVSQVSEVNNIQFTTNALRIAAPAQGKPPEQMINHTVNNVN